MDLLGNISEKLTVLVGTPLSVLVHTILFIGIFLLTRFGVSFDQVLLILTTAVSLEAIYLAIFIQMSVNKTTAHLAEVKSDISDIQEDVEGLEEDVEDIQEDVEDISEDYEEDEKEEDKMLRTLKDIEKQIKILHSEIENLKK